MKKVKIVAIRVDAAIAMGTGHVMRCLTLARSLRSRKVLCHFICRARQGSMVGAIRLLGFDVTELPVEENGNLSAYQVEDLHLSHSEWLGCDWLQDAEQTIRAIKPLEPDMLVVDHYSIDFRWEQLIRPHVHYIMVIDDLANRSHECDVLLDQNLGREVVHYLSKVPKTCTVLAGSRYALLRPEFAERRIYSLDRRRHSAVQKLLITMGGIDANNATGQVLSALKNSLLPEGCCITVVMGPKAPWLQNVSQLAASMPWPTEVQVDVENMAQLMAESDLAVSAAGGTSWELCCLGVPSILIVLAENQIPVAQALGLACGALVIERASNISSVLPYYVSQLQLPQNLSLMHKTTTQITDGLGAQRVVDVIEAFDVK